MISRIVLVCLLFAGSSLACRWMDTNFEQYSRSSLALLNAMNTNSTNSTEDAKLPESAFFPNQLYEHASKELHKELRYRFVAHVLHEIEKLFDKDQMRASWSDRSGDDFLDVVKQLAKGVRSCVGKHHHHHPHHHHSSKILKKMSLYFERISRQVLEEMGYSAGALELIREQVRLHLHRVQRLAFSS